MVKVMDAVKAHLQSEPFDVQVGFCQQMLGPVDPKLITVAADRLPGSPR